MNGKTGGLMRFHDVEAPLHNGKRAADEKEPPAHKSHDVII